MGKKKKRGRSNQKINTENILLDCEEITQNSPVKSLQEESSSGVGEITLISSGKPFGGELSNQEKGPKYTSEDLMERVEQYLENFEYDMALTFCKKALVLDPSNIQVLEGAGNVCAEIGDVVNAKKYFQKAVELESDKGHVKYLYLGQLSDGEEAVKYYELAIPLMKKEFDEYDNNVEDGDTERRRLSKKDISNVYCSLAEIYMTDLCVEEGAESICEKYCKLAMEADESNIEAVVSMCNLLLSQNNIESAKIVVVRAYDLWCYLSKETDDESLPDVMSYEARVTLIKLLIEVEKYDKVSGIVDQLIEENEDDIRIWYYLGLAKFLMKDADNPRFYLEKAVELYSKTNCTDEEMLAHIKELLESCPNDDDCVNENMDTIEENDEGSSDNEHNNSMNVE